MILLHYNTLYIYLIIQRNIKIVKYLKKKNKPNINTIYNIIPIIIVTLYFFILLCMPYIMIYYFLLTNIKYIL